MEDHGENKVLGIRQIVKLKEMLQKWQNVTLGQRVNDIIINNNDNNIQNNNEEELDRYVGISPAICKRLKGVSSTCDSDEDSCHSPEPPLDVPKGYLAVYVGPELQLRRFIIPTTYLTDPLFKLLLEKVEEEFGFDHRGGLTIPCEVETFKYLLNCMENRHNDNHPQLDHHTGGTSLTIEE